MSNTLLNKYLLPYRITAGLMLGVSIASINLAQKESKLAKVIYQDDYYAHSDTNYFLCVLLIIISLGLSGYGFISIPKQAKEKSNKLTKQYLQEIFTKYPELRKYESVLSNPEKLQEIAAFACNNLSKVEQNQILNIVKNTFDKSENPEISEAEIQANIKKAENDILAIIKHHEATNPGYLQKILSVIDKNILVMSINNQKGTMIVGSKTR